MIWLTFRQYRTELLFAGPALIALVAFFVMTGLDLHAAWNERSLNDCLSERDISNTCLGQVQDLLQRYGWMDQVVIGLIFLPPLIGIALAAPLVLDFEHRTYRLAWTQSVGRSRWLITQLIIALLIAAAASALVAILVDWWYGPSDDIEGRLGNNFGFVGPALISYTVFALSTAVALGVITKRAFPTFVSATAVFVASQIVIGGFLRLHYLAPKERAAPLDAPIPPGDFIIRTRIVDRDGSEVARLPCLIKDPDCIVPDGLSTVIVYHPADRFWLFQGIETAIFVGMAVVLLAIAIWWVTRRLT